LPSVYCRRFVDGLANEAFFDHASHKEPLLVVPCTD
jgi:hypothetical protein